MKLHFVFNKIICAVMAVVMLMSLTVIACATETEQNNIVRVGYMLHDNYQEGLSGEIKSGYGYEYLQMLRNYTGWEYEYVYASSWEEQVAMLERGEIDLMLHAFLTAERMNTMLFSADPMGKESNYVYTRGGNSEVVAGDIDSLNGKVVGCMAGDFRYNIFTEWCEDYSVKCKVISYKDLTAMHNALSDGMIDAIVGSDFTASAYPGDWEITMRLGDQSIYIAVALGRDDLLAQVNAAQSQILALNPYYPDEVRKKYQDTLFTYVPELTEEQKEVLRSRGTLTVGYCREHRPIAFTDSETGELHGILADYLSAMTATYGINFDTVEYNSDILLEEALRNGTVDIIAPVGYTYGVAENIGFAITTPITEEAMIALFRADKVSEIQNIFNRIVFLEKSVTEKYYVEQYYPEAEQVYADSVEMAIDMVQNGSADCYLVNTSAWSWYSGEYAQIQELKVLNLPNDTEINMAVRSEDVALIPILNLGIDLLDETAVNQAIIAYSNASDEVTLWTLITDNPFNTATLIIICGLVIVLIFVVYRMRTESRYVDKLKAAKSEAEYANMAKSNFLSSLSHDIRTPMNAIIGFTNFIKESDDLTTVRDDYVPKIETASHQLLMLIDDALEMSRIESGRLTFNREVQDIRKIIDGVTTVIQIQADGKGIALETDISVQNPVVNCDSTHLSRVLMNLLSNAVKFTPSGGKVTFTVFEKPVSKNGYTEFQIKVTDTGIGMSPEFLERVFETFERERTSTISGLQGTGLGLAIVKRIIDTAGDTISVKSTKGEGTEFTMDIALLRDSQENICGAMSDNSEELTSENMAKRFNGRHILLVEDNELNLTIAQTILEESGFVVDTAMDGTEAVDKVTAAPAPDYYDVILMDIQMPVMDGYEATRAIRALADKRAETKIIAVTANAFDSDKANAAKAGMNAHISKPIDINELYKTLCSILDD